MLIYCSSFLNGSTYIMHIFFARELRLYSILLIHYQLSDSIADHCKLAILNRISRVFSNILKISRMFPLMDTPNCPFQKLIILFGWETIKEYLIYKQHGGEIWKNIIANHVHNGTKKTAWLWKKVLYFRYYTWKVAT